MSSQSIGDLSIGVALDTRSMDAGFATLDRKTKAQIKQLDAEYKKLGDSINRNAFGFGGGYGTGYASAGRRFGGMGGGGGFSRGGMAVQNIGYQAQDIAVQIAGGQGVVRALGQQLPQILQFFGPTGAVAGALLATAFAFRKELMAAGEAFGDALNGGQGFSTGRAAEALQRNLDSIAKDQGFNSWAEYNEAVKGQRGANRDLARNLAFNGTDDQGRARILQGEIAKLTRDAENAKAERRTFDFEKMRGEIATKTAELEKLNKQIEQRQLDFENQARLDQARRLDEQDAERAKRTQEAMDNGVSDLLRDLDSQREINALRVGAIAPNVSVGASSLGGTASDGTIAAGLIKENQKTLNAMLDVLRQMAEQAAFQRN